MTTTRKACFWYSKKKQEKGKKENHDCGILLEWNLNVKASFQACCLPSDFRPLPICLRLLGHPLFPEICCSNLSSNSHFHSSTSRSYFPPVTSTDPNSIANLFTTITSNIKQKSSKKVNSWEVKTIKIYNNT